LVQLEWYGDCDWRVHPPSILINPFLPIIAPQNGIDLVPTGVLHIGSAKIGMGDYINQLLETTL
jgi:hypothetical protein